MFHCSVSWSLQQWQNSSHTRAKWHRSPPRLRHHQPALNNPCWCETDTADSETQCRLSFTPPPTARWDLSHRRPKSDPKLKRLGEEKRKSHFTLSSRCSSCHHASALLLTFNLILTTTANYTWRLVLTQHCSEVWLKVTRPEASARRKVCPADSFLPLQNVNLAQRLDRRDFPL